MRTTSAPVQPTPANSNVQHSQQQQQQQQLTFSVVGQNNLNPQKEINLVPVQQNTRENGDLMDAASEIRAAVAEAPAEGSVALTGAREGADGTARPEWYKFVAFENAFRPPPPRSEDPSYDRDEHLRELLNDEREQAIYEKFREKYDAQQYEFDSNTYHRILWSREYDLEQAYQRLDGLIKWRREINIDTLSMGNFPDYLQKQIYLYVGKDYQGRPIALVRASKILPDQYDTQKLTMFFVSFLQFLISQMTGYVDSYIIILDVQDLTSRNISLEYLKGQIQMLMQYYCSRSYKMRVVNSGWLANWAYKLVSGLLSKRTQSKVKFVGTDLDAIREMLLQDMDEETLPAIYGGKNQMKFYE